MIIPAIVILWIFLTLCGVLLVVAIAHVILGLRNSGGSPTVVMTSAYFLVFIALIGWLSWMFLRSVDWGGNFNLSFPGSTTTQSDTSL